jgi:hypothetical protein
MAEEGASFGRMLAEPAARLEAFTASCKKRKPDCSACDVPSRQVADLNFAI